MLARALSAGLLRPATTHAQGQGWSTGPKHGSEHRLHFGSTRTSAVAGLRKAIQQDVERALAGGC